jgi:S1-C subfamily serine protease
MPSLDALRASKLEKATPPETASSGGQVGILDSVALCRAYIRGSGILLRYHEPPSKRSSTGISVFKSAPQSVVLVVTGTVKNGETGDLGLGTGVIVDPAGYVLTNWHVIAGYRDALIFLKPALRAEPLDANAYGAGTAGCPSPNLAFRQRHSRNSG